MSEPIPDDDLEALFARQRVADRERSPAFHAMRTRSLKDRVEAHAPAAGVALGFADGGRARADRRRFARHASSDGASHATARCPGAPARGNRCRLAKERGSPTRTHRLAIAHRLSPASHPKRKPPMKTTLLAAASLLAFLAHHAFAAPIPIESELFPPDFLFAQRDALGLSETQLQDFQAIVQDVQPKFEALKGQLEERAKAFQEILHQPKPEIAQVEEKLRNKLAQENEMKVLQVRLMLDLRSKLTTEQVDKARQLRPQQPPAAPRSNPSRGPARAPAGEVRKAPWPPSKRARPAASRRRRSSWPRRARSSSSPRTASRSKPSASIDALLIVLLRRAKPKP